MSYEYVLFDDPDSEPIGGGSAGTLSGWHGFSEWVQYLTDVDELRYLVEYGWADDLPALEEQLAAALANGEPDDNSKSVGVCLLANLRVANLRERGAPKLIIIGDGSTDIETGVPANAETA